MSRCSHCLLYSVTTNESKEKFKINFCFFSEIKNIAPLSSYNFPAKLIFCLNKSIPVSLSYFWWYENPKKFPVA